MSQPEIFGGVSAAKEGVILHIAARIAKTVAATLII
jgi:hypothetical protein